MLDRRQSNRERVILSGGVSAERSGSRTDVTIRNISNTGAALEVPAGVKFPPMIDLSIARKGRSFLARVIWWRNNRIGVAFDNPLEAPTGATSDLEDRLRKAERQNRALKRRVKQLCGEG